MRRARDPAAAAVIPFLRSWNALGGAWRPGARPAPSRAIPLRKRAPKILHEQAVKMTQTVPDADARGEKGRYGNQDWHSARMGA